MVGASTSTISVGLVIVAPLGSAGSPSIEPHTMDASGYVALPVTRIRIRWSDWNAMQPGLRPISSAALIRDASALWRRDPPAIAMISPPSYSCFIPLSCS